MIIFTMQSALETRISCFTQEMFAKVLPLVVFLYSVRSTSAFCFCLSVYTNLQWMRRIKGDHNTTFN